MKIVDHLSILDCFKGRVGTYISFYPAVLKANLTNLLDLYVNYLNAEYFLI